ncbi:hypothetical protein RQP46_006483 [Phenoliferia psychrophenolica]
MSSSKSEKASSQCQFCEKSFKKLEHRQRHERVHTLDRPYTCASCGKTFARQDTLNRHARLHNRKEDGTSVVIKGRRKRISSVSSHDGGGKAGADSAAFEPASPQSPGHTSLRPFGSYSLPVTVPSFPSYSHPAQQMHDHRRRMSDASYPGLLGMQLGLDRTEPEDPFAHLMSAFDPITPHSDSSGSDSEGDDEPESLVSPAATSVEMELDSFFDNPTSQLPSPAVSSYSPSDLHDTLAPFPESVDSYADLQAILANDPCHPGAVSAAPPTEDHLSFDYDHFAASVEGPTTTTSSSSGGGGVAISLEDLINTQIKAYPTPTSTHHASLHSQPPSHLDFNFDQYSEARSQCEQRFALQAALAAAPLPSPTSDVPITSRASMSMPSMTIPSSVEIPVRGRLASISIAHSAASFQNAYASSFPSLSVMPNGLGLHDTAAPLFDAYSRKALVPTSTAGGLPTPPTPAPQPAFYMPNSTSEPRPRLPVALPSWSNLSFDGAESREPGASLFA